MSRPILVMDSGVGGLTILAAVRQALPHHHFVYLADWERFPYGGRSREELVARLQQIVSLSIAQFAPQLVVIACNTASTIALPALRQTWPELPFVGVVPAVKPAAQLTRTASIAVLATASTVSNGYTEKLCREFAPSCEVALIAAPTLVRLAEDYMADDTVPVDLTALARAVDKRAARADTCVLACTHFPIMHEALAAALPQIQYWVDSSEAIARRVATLVTAQENLGYAEPGTLRMVCTAHPKVHKINLQWQAALGIAQLDWLRLQR